MLAAENVWRFANPNHLLPLPVDGAASAAKEQRYFRLRYLYHRIADEGIDAQPLRS